LQNPVFSVQWICIEHTLLNGQKKGSILFSTHKFVSLFLMKRILNIEGIAEHSTQS